MYVLITWLMVWVSLSRTVATLSAVENLSGAHIEKQVSDWFAAGCEV